MRQRKHKDHRFHVTIGVGNRAYGGPEEGGWWFDTWEPTDDPGDMNKVFKHHKAARRYCLRMNRIADQFNRDDAEFGFNRDISSVNCDGAYSFNLTKGPAKAYPEHRPHYE